MAETDYVKLAIKIAGKVFKVIKKEILKGSLKDGPSKEKNNGKHMEDCS